MTREDLFKHAYTSICGPSKLREDLFKHAHTSIFGPSQLCKLELWISHFVSLRV